VKMRLSLWRRRAALSEMGKKKKGKRKGDARASARKRPREGKRDLRARAQSWISHGLHHLVLFLWG
jgi:hypothetical protein